MYPDALRLGIFIVVLGVIALVWQLYKIMKGK
jgi:hypothetical protein